jgi:outer membrane protein TolC
VPVLGELSEPQGPPDAVLELEDLLASVETHFPLILAALEEVEIAAGRVLSARGAFDTRFGTKGRFDVEGFYENDRVDVLFEQPTTAWGTTFLGGYRIGSGDFAIYDGKAKTNDGGELRFGVNVPLLQGGSIDTRRVELWRSAIEQEQVRPIVTEKRLQATRKAADAYWRWVSWGRRHEIARRLLDLAENRQDQVELAVEEGQLARINLTDNQRLIVERRANLVRAERGLQQAAILLSLYWRDADGQPVVPPEAALPEDFPPPRDPALVLFEGDVAFALERRPELRALELELSSLDLDLSLARNDMLPTLDVGVLASQDVGAPVNDPDDKGPFELSALLRLDVPLQRRQARGDRREVEGKIAKLTRERQFVEDVVVTDVRDAALGLTQTWAQMEQARENVRLARELAEAERLQLQAGESDLLRVNLREQQAAVAAAALVDVFEEYFRALAQYRAVLGLTYDEVVVRELGRP